jgi:hypothetical protein
MMVPLLRTEASLLILAIVHKGIALIHHANSVDRVTSPLVSFDYSIYLCSKQKTFRSYLTVSQLKEATEYQVIRYL